MKVNYKITTECPANCECCQERLNNFRVNSNELHPDYKLFERIIQLFKDSRDSENSISITGGEPTLVTDLPYIVEQFTKANIKAGIDTNGWNITEFWIQDMENAGLDYILFSYYSLKKEVFDLLRGSEQSALFERSSNAVSMLKNYKKAGGKVKVRQQTVIMKQNYQELPDLLEFALNCGFDTLSTAYYISSNEDEKLALSEKDIVLFKDVVTNKLYQKLVDRSMDEKLLSENLERIRRFFVFDDIPLDQISKGYYRKEGSMCNETNKLVIYPNGDVVPCLGFDYIMDRSYAENIKEKDYKSIKNSEKFKKFWGKPYKLCNRCSSGYQVWINLTK